jgi:hypothetical protein
MRKHGFINDIADLLANSLSQRLAGTENQLTVSFLQFIYPGNRTLPEYRFHDHSVIKILFVLNPLEYLS